MAVPDSKAAGAQLGPRLIGRLTPELVLRSPQYMNCVNQYEIDLRANRIAAIENLGATEVHRRRRRARRARRCPAHAASDAPGCCRRTSLTA